jgi:hypothetical protein
MSTLYRLGEEEVILITGAPDVLFRLCQYQQTNDGLQPFDQPYWKGRLKSMPAKGCAWWLRPGNPPARGNVSWITLTCRMVLFCSVSPE